MGNTKTENEKRRIEEDKQEKRIKDYKNRQTCTILETEPKHYRFISFDVETIGRNNDFYICGILDYNGEYKTYYDIEEVIDYFKRIKHNDIMIVATNLEFDFSVIFKKSLMINKCEFIVNSGHFIMVTMNGTYNKIKFYDTLNFGGFSVETMGKILGKPKLKHPSCLGKKPKNKKEEKEMVEYNKRDCEVSQDFMIMLQEAINKEGGELKPTVSSCALDIYRRRFMPFNMIREEIWNGIKVKDKVHKAYYGGRTEAFKRGKIENYNYYDVNSLYPFCMLNKYPVPQTVFYVSSSTKDVDIKFYLQFEGVSHFKLNIPYTKYPLLPYRFNKRLVFPVGKFAGYYTHVEIRRAIELYGEKIILEMKDCTYYTDTFPVFKNYVDFMYKKRLEAKEQKSSFEVFYKLMMNSLYGKFAMKNITNTEYFIPETNEDVLFNIKRGSDKANISVNMGELSYINNPREYDGIFSFPIWSCYVTAYARILMHKYICESEPVYIDTDSLFTTKEIKSGKLLGELKLECVIKHGIIIKPKAYYINESVKFKGLRIPKDQKHVDRLFKNVLEQKPIRYEKFVKIKEGIKRKMNINSIIVVEKHVDLEDIKRNWCGKKFNPLELQDSEPLVLSEF